MHKHVSLLKPHDWELPSLQWSTCHSSKTEKETLIQLPQYYKTIFIRKMLPFSLVASQHKMELVRWRQMAQKPTADWRNYFVYVRKSKTSILTGSGCNTLATETVQDSNLSIVGSKGEVNRIGWWCYYLTCGLSSINSVYKTYDMWWTLRQVLKAGAQHAEVNKWAKSYLQHN